MATLAIVGGQYGSEGKGVVANALSHRMKAAVRVGGSNAGHSFVHDGHTWKMRMIPCAWTNPDALLCLGPAAVVDVPVLMDEIETLEAAGYQIRNRLVIDRRATIQTKGDVAMEVNYDRIGSTQKGIGAARIRRIERDERAWVKAQDALPGSIAVNDTAWMYRQLAEAPPSSGIWVMLEGTQGFGLSLTYGQWPFVTSTDLTVAQLLNDCGLSPNLPLASIMVMRTYPIRVAGNSGPLYKELSWDDMSARLGKTVVERTTVTNKVRRVGHFDWDQAREAVAVNRPTGIALTFADYLDPSIEGVTDYDDLGPVVMDFIEEIERKLDVGVLVVGTGGADFALATAPGSALLGWGPRSR